MIDEIESIDLASFVSEHEEALAKIAEKALSHSEKISLFATVLAAHEEELTKFAQQWPEIANEIRGKLESWSDDTKKQLEAKKTEVSTAEAELRENLSTWKLEGIAKLTQLQDVSLQELRSKALDYLKTEVEKVQNAQEKAVLEFQNEAKTALKTVLGQAEKAVTIALETAKQPLPTAAEVSRLALAQIEKPQDGKNGSIIDTFRGNWTVDLVLKRGDTFAFRGGFYLCYKDVVGEMPTRQNQKEPDPTYAILAAPGAPAPVQPVSSGSSSGGTVTGALNLGTGIGLFTSLATPNLQFLSVTGGTAVTATIVGSAVTFDLRNSGVVAATYGSTTQSAVVQVDSLGRVVSASTVAIAFPAAPSGGNPTATIGLTRTNGSSTSFMRSDAAPPIDQAMTPTWTGSHNFQNAMTISKSGLVNSGISYLVDANYTAAPTGTDQPFGIKSQLTFNGTATPVSAAHGAAIIGRAIDTATNKHNMIGLEGKIDATGAASAYTGFSGDAAFAGTSFTNQTLYGMAVTRLSITSDGTTPLAQGTAIGLYIPPATGGAAKFSAIFGDPLVVNNAVFTTNTANTKSLQLYHNGTDCVVQSNASSGHIYMVAPAGNYVIVSADGILPVSTGKALGLAGVLEWALAATTGQFSGAITPSQTAGIVGTTTNNNVNAGSVGEYVSSALSTASTAAVTMSNNTVANVLSISLTAGDWDLEGNVNLVASSATVTAEVAGISTTSATLPTDGTEVYSGVITTAASEVDSIVLPRKRISIGATTTAYLVSRVSFSAGTEKASGSISARRVR